MTGKNDNADLVVGPDKMHFNELSAEAGYIELYGSGHTVFVDPPIGFLVDKFFPTIGSVREVTLHTCTRNRAAVVNLSALLYDAYPKQDATALQAVRTGDLDFVGVYTARNMPWKKQDPSLRRASAS